MLNQCVLVGKVKQLPVIKQTANGNNYAQLVLEVDRNFRNSDGTLSTDLFQVTLWKGIAEMCMDVCKIDDIIALKGRLQAYVYESDKNKTYYNAEVIAEKVSFLTARCENQ
ncbi:MAG TPA: single-stranded DNA-binding protein [Erysipelotrichaceae bacterium]|nr:single-stranded DNA-binding protein [Erysipelotrichaceae bacterium]HCY05880.1 single-stranded DNA-binding protein [Erysipelotrichaceae bacterium]